MSSVRPNEAGVVKYVTDINLIERLLIKHHSQREADAWAFAVNVALRIGDMRQIKFEDINDDKLIIREQKTSKLRIVTLNARARKIVSKRRLENPDHTYLFQSVSRNVSAPRPITSQYFNRALKSVGEIVGIKLSSHSARKTRGYHLLKSGVPLTTICKMFGHSSPAITLAYIGITSEDIEKTYTDLVL